MASKLYTLPPKHIKMTQRPADFTINRENSLAQGLVFAGLGKFPGTNQYTENSGYSNHGTLTGFSGVGDTPADKWQFIPQLERMGLGFDGSNDYIILSDVPSLLITGDMSVSTWINSTETRDVTSTLIQKFHNSPPYEGYIVCASNPTIGKMGFFYAVSGWKSATAAHNDGTWHHIALTIKSGVYNFYLDGKPNGNGTCAATITNYATSPWINRYSSPALYGNMILSDLCVLSRALSPAEIAALADPSNVMLSGLLSAPRRKYISFPSGFTTTYYPLPYTVHP